MKLPDFSSIPSKYTPVGNGRYSASIYQTTHLQGGTAMGTAPDDSVINTHLQHWDVPNL